MTQASLRRLQLQPLEERTNPSTMSLVGTTLQILGTDGNDVIRVRQSTAGVLTVQGIPGQYNVSSVSKIEVYGYGGSDTIDFISGNVSGEVPITLSTALYGGTGNDFIHGGAGNDYIDGGDGSDVIVGWGGNDYLIGGNNNDLILGMTGNDTIFGLNGDDILDGGAGNDTLFGGLGNDRIYGGDTGPNFLDGGTGTDLLSATGSAPAPLQTIPEGTPTPTSPSTTLPPTSSVPTVSISSAEQQIITLVNQERAKVGLKALTVNSKLMQAAQIQSTNMALVNVMAHDLSAYPQVAQPTLVSRLNFVGYNYRSAGENIAYNYSSPTAVMTGWMNSPGHRANILSTDYTEIGVSIRYNTKGEPYYTQEFGRS